MAHFPSVIYQSAWILEMPSGYYIHWLNKGYHLDPIHFFYRQDHGTFSILSTSWILKNTGNIFKLIKHHSWKSASLDFPNYDYKTNTKLDRENINIVG